MNRPRNAQSGRSATGGTHGRVPETACKRGSTGCLESSRCHTSQFGLTVAASASYSGRMRCLGGVLIGPAWPKLLASRQLARTSGQPVSSAVASSDDAVVNKGSTRNPRTLECMRADVAQPGRLTSVQQSLQEAGVHFNPKVAGSIPARPFDFAAQQGFLNSCVVCLSKSV